MQELNNFIIDETELTALIVGGDWNCTLSKKDKLGGIAWALTVYRNLVLTTKDMFDLIDIQRKRHPKLCKFTYESKAKGRKSRIDFLLMTKNLTKSVKKTEIYPSIAPDHNAIYISLFWYVNKTPRGPGFWKFNNTLLKDEKYAAIVWETYTNTLRYYEQVSYKRLQWEFIKMEIRNTTISYTKHKAKMSGDRPKDIRQQLGQLNEIVCKDFFPSDIYQVLQCYDSLKSELQSSYEGKGKHAMFRAKCRWVFLAWKKKQKDH